MNPINGTNNKALYAKVEAYEQELKDYESSMEEASKNGSKALEEWFSNGPKKPTYPLTDGQSKAMRLIIWNETDELQFDDNVWDDEYHDFVEVLRDEGVETFVVLDTSTALMRCMHGYAAEGCTLVGLCEVETGRMDWSFGRNGEEPEVRQGVRFAL